MKIKRMTASFGKLRGAVLELGEGLNLIEAPNEGGKSTWCAFLRAMLYGIPTRERDRQGHIAEKNRYQPWDGGALEGALELAWRGREITLRRWPKGSTPFGGFSAVFTGTEEPVPGLNAENCGETLLGVSREVWERSAFVGQGGAAIGESAELERRIAALVSTGEEEVSYTQVEGKLREWLRRRKFNKNGLIPKLENERAVLDDTLEHQKRARSQAEDARREIAALTARRDGLRASLDAWRGRENQERLRVYEEAGMGLRAARSEADALEAERSKYGSPPGREALRQAQEDLGYLKTVSASLRLAEGQREAADIAAEAAAEAARDPLFPDMNADEAWRKAGEDRDAAAEQRRPWPLPSKLLLILGVLALGACLFFALTTRHRVPLLAACGALALLNLCNLGYGLHQIGKARRCGENAAGILAQYGVEYPDDILTKANEYRDRCVAAQEAARKAETLEEAIREMKAQREELTASLLALVHTFEPEVKDLFGISAALSRALSLDERLATARVRLEGAQKLVENLPRPDAAPRSPETAGEEAEGFSPAEAAAALAAAENELSRLKSELAMAQGELNTLGDPTLFEARREALSGELERRREEYGALTLALEALGAANADLQARFSPALNEAAGEVLAALTGGKYAKVALTREFEALAAEAGSPLPRRALALSQGTAEQVYLAARLAVCALALPEDAPLVLDDALDAFDDARTALALEYLRALGASRQILLFTCHSREAAMLKGAEDVAVRSLQS